MKFSAPLVLTLALTWVFASSDKITIKMFKDLGEVGIYSGAFKVVSLLTVIQSGFTTFWTPTALEHYSKNPEDTEFYKKANDYLSLIFFILCFIFSSSLRSFPLLKFLEKTSFKFK